MPEVPGPPGVDADVGIDIDADVLVGYVGDRPHVVTLDLGNGARLRSGTVLYAGSRIGPRLATGHHVVIREQCELGADVSIWSNTVIDYACRIGDRVKIHSNCYVAQFTQVDDDAFLAPGVTVANDLYPGDLDSRAVMAGAHIGAGARIGVNVTLLPFVRIGPRALIGAGSVVTRDVPADAVAYGNPARVTGYVWDLASARRRVQPDPASASRYRLAEPRSGP